MFLILVLQVKILGRIDRFQNKAGTAGVIMKTVILFTEKHGFMT